MTHTTGKPTREPTGASRRLQVTKLLCNKVRTLATHQIQDRFFANAKSPRTATAKFVSRLVRDDLVVTSRISAARLSISSPLLVWLPSSAEPPNWERLAYANQKRWQIEPQHTTCLIATARAHGLYGGRPRRIRSLELEHDMAVAAVYLSLDQHRARDWVLEDNIRPNSIRCRRPDALIEGTDPTVIDVIGRGYSAEKIELIWRAFRNHRLELR